MAPSMGIFSRRKNSEDKSLRGLLSATPSYESHEFSNRSVSDVDGSDSILGTHRFITRPHYVAPKPIVTGTYGGGSFGLVHAPALSRPRNTAITPIPPGLGSNLKPDSSKSQASSSKGKKVNRSKSEVTSIVKKSKEDKGDSRKSAVPALATVYSQSQLTNFEAHHIPPRRIQTPTRPPGTPPNRAQDIPVSLSPGVGILPNDLPEPLRQFSTESSPAGSPKSMTFNFGPYLDGQGNNSGSRLQLTPPISPESSIRAQNLANIAPFGIMNQSFGDHHMGIPGSGPSAVAPLNVRKKKTESDLIVEIAALKKSLNIKDEIIQKLDPNFQADNSVPNSDLQRMNQVLMRRIRDLEKTNNEREESLSRHASKFQALRQSHHALVETMRISYEAEISSLKESLKSMDKAKHMSLPDAEEQTRLRKREVELVRVVRERDEELEVMWKDTNELREKLGLVEKLVAQRDGELEVAERRVKRVSEQIPTIGMSDLRSSEEENAEMVKRLDEEIRLREVAERELDEVVAKYKSDLEEALAAERTKARKEQQRMLDEEKGKREQYKAQIWKEVEEILHEEEDKHDKAIAFAQEELKTRMEQEEKRRAELAASYNIKFSELEQARKVDLDEFELRLGIKKESEHALLAQTQELQARVAELQGLLDRDKDAIESLKNSHEDIMRIAKRINERLGEEKRRNKHLEESARSLTSTSIYPLLPNTPSIDSNLADEVMQLKQQLSDRDAEFGVLTTELDAWKAEFESVDEAWRKLDAEAKGFEEVLGEKDKRIDELERENKGMTLTLEIYRGEFGKLTKRASAASEKVAQDGGVGSEESEQGVIIIKAEVLKDLAGRPVPEDAEDKGDSFQLNLLEQFSQSQSALAEANKEIYLYKLDVKGYRKDLRRRDAQIANLNKKIGELEYALQQRSLEIAAVQDELHLERRLPEPHSPKIENQNIHLLAGKISSVKDENLQLKQRVRIQEDELRQVMEERENLKKMLQQYTEQHGLVIADLEIKVEKLKGEKEQVERRAKKKIAELKSNATPMVPLPLTIPHRGEGFTESVLNIASSPVDRPSSASTITPAKLKRRHSHSRSQSLGGGRAHSRSSSRDIIYAPSPINTNILPPQFPSPNTPLPPLPPKSPPLKIPPFPRPSTAETMQPRPGTASSDEDFSPLGIMSPLGLGSGSGAGLSAQPRRKKAPEKGGAAVGKRLSIVHEPPRTLGVVQKKEGIKSPVGGGGGGAKRGSAEGKELPKLPDEAAEVGGSRVRPPVGTGGRSGGRVPLSAVVMPREERKIREMCASGEASGEASGSGDGKEAKEEEGCEVVFW